MDISVAICTWNRSKLLKATLESMTRLVVPNHIEWELLIVDNNSTDGTQEVIEEYESKLPIVSLFESAQGLSNARNCALASARGDLLVWTDDDVQVEENWLIEYDRARLLYPRADYFGGVVRPWWTFPKPWWFAGNESLLAGILVARDFGGEERPFLASQQPFGANMAFRRRVYATQRFDSSLGRNGDGLIAGEETDYIKRIQAAGKLGIWVPTAIVEHYVEPHRMTARHIWRFFIGGGRTKVRVEGYSESGPPRWMYRQLVESYCGYITRRCVGNRRWVKSLADAGFWYGMIKERRIAERPVDQTR